MMRRTLSVGGDPWPSRTRRVALALHRGRMETRAHRTGMYVPLTHADAPLRTVTGSYEPTYRTTVETHAVDNSGHVDKYVPVSMADFPQRDRLDAATERMIEACVRRAQRMYFGDE